MNTGRLSAFALLALGISAVAQQGMAHPAITPPPAQSSAAVPMTPSSTPGSPMDSATYQIGADDGLQITVWKEPSLSGPLVVRPDGQISMPLIGDVPASGLTPMQLSQELTTRLKKFVNEPTVTVVVTAVNSKRVFVIGQVQHIGAVNITPGMTVLQAIASAGGLTPYANGKKIYILRGPQGSQKRIPFNYKVAIRDGNQQGVTLVPGDTIVVP
jgi:polysaccharide export outer membrane protein